MIATTGAQSNRRNCTDLSPGGSAAGDGRCSIAASSVRGARRSAFSRLDPAQTAPM